MIDKDFKDFSVLMNFLAENCSNSTVIAKTRMQLIFDMTKDLEIRDIKENVFRLLKTRIYTNFPSIAEIRGVTTENIQERSLNAWVFVRKALNDHGYYDSVQFDDPVIHSCIKAFGGWPRFCEELPLDDQWVQKEFERLYQMFSKQKNHPEYLQGFHEIYNSSKGFISQSIVKIITKEPKIAIEDKLAKEKP